jgi:hypothetical protein
MSLFATPEQRFRVAVLASLQRIERVLGVDHVAFKTLIAMENHEMTTLAEIATKAQALADAEGAAQVTIQHERDAAAAQIADLTKQRDDALAANASAAAANAAPAIDQAQLDAIGAALDKATAIATALAPAPAPAAAAIPVV